MNDPSQPTPEPNQPQEVRHQHVSARVPERVSRGAFSTGAIVMTGGTEFVIDFVQNVGPPASVAARIVMPHAVMPQFIDALRKNLEIYKQRFGDPPELPRPQPGQKQPTPQEIYDDLKLADDIMVGAYANGVMISHTASEFRMDFLTNLFPHPAVSSRVFLSSPQIPRLLESLSNTFQQFQKRVQQQQQKPKDDEPPSEGSQGQYPQ